MTAPDIPAARRGRGRPSLGPHRLEVRVDLDVLDGVLADGETPQQLAAAAIAREVARRRRAQKTRPDTLKEQQA